MTEKIVVPMDAARVCDAIAKIGYSASSAIMDIVDNSVTAGATNVTIHVEVRADSVMSDKSNVTRFTILDNGSGMDDAGILNALKLGSAAQYPPKSLSKYGMGLKSAGLSLGSRITVVSRKATVLSSLYYIDRKEMAAGDYIVCKESLPAQSPLATLLGQPSGTAVEIITSEASNQESAQRTLGQLTEKLGVVYYEFINNQGLTITIKVRKPSDSGTVETLQDVVVKPFDILFLGEAEPAFDKDNYSGKSPAKVLSEPFNLTADTKIPPITIDAVIFPKNNMSNNPAFSAEERQKIKSYKISRANKGFFIYRNGRLIKWADDLEGGVGKDDINFRGRILIGTEHDDILHVDVSKQHLGIPEDVLDRIDRVIQQPLKLAETARELCAAILHQDEKEGAEFNQRNVALVEEDLDAGEPVKASPETKKRKKELNDDTKKSLDDSGEEAIPSQPTLDKESGLPVFERVRYSEKVSSINLWESGHDAGYGTFVRINKNHPFYQTVLSNLLASDPSRQALEALIWSLAIAENKTVINLVDIDKKDIAKVLSRYKKVVGTNLDSWCAENHDLYGAE
jgi:hypothetical protein